MIKSVWQQRQYVSGQQQKRLGETGGGHRQLVPPVVVEENSVHDSGVKSSGKPKWKLYKNSRFKKGLDYFRWSKSDDKLNQISSVLVSNENDVILKSDQILIPKSDKNWIRIHVSYDEERIESHLEDCVSEVKVCCDHKNLKYNESAIDVPADFCNCTCNTPSVGGSKKFKQRQKRANNFRRAIADFLHEDLVQREHDGQQDLHYIVEDCCGVRRKYGSASQTKNSLRMGVNCSTAITKLRHHSVVPTDSNVIIVREQHSAVDKRQQLQPQPQQPPPPQPPQPPAVSPHKSFDKNDNIRNTPVRANAPLRRVTTAFDEPKPSTYEDLLKTNLSVPPTLSSSIEWDNILHRRNDVVRTQKPNLVNSSTQTQSPNKTSASFSVSHNKQSLKIPSNHRLSSSSSSSLATTSSWATNRNSGNGGTATGSGFLKNFSGSVQNLVNFQFGGKSGRLKSASENNLSKLSNVKLSKKSRNMYSSNLEVDYCPSVLYNRKQVAESKASTMSSEKGVNMKNLKRFFNNINMPRIRRPKDSNGNIQDIDGAFFEKFGSLLRQKSQLDETVLAPLPEEDVAVEFAPRMATLDEAENDSGTETLQETDSEPDDPKSKQERFIEDAVGMNIDELYEEILYEVLHNIGCEDSSEVNQNTLFEYVQEAFKVSAEKHAEILRAAESKEPPQIRLNVEVVKAENLMPKDSNGFSDPFVTMYIESCSTHRYNTSVKSATLNPLWEEHFSLPIPDNPNNEILILEVWDFDPAETVGEKMGKFFEVKGVKGFRKLMKEIAITASTGKHDNELIGRAAIPLKTIPVSGIQVWYSLEKGTKTKSRGSVLVRMSFSAEKNSRVAAQEHRNLLRLLLLHELETSKVAPYWWSGKFSAQGEAVLQQHSAQSGLTSIDCALAQWSVYTNIHQDHPLSFGLFINLLDKILGTVETLQSDDEEVKSFWEGVRKLLPSCYSNIRKIRKKTAGDKNCVKMLSEILDILSKISTIDPPEGTDLFPKQVYGWITRGEDVELSLHSVMRDAVRSGASEWYETINEGSECRNDATEEDRLQHLIKLIQLIRSDLQRAIEYYDKHFQMKMHFPYAQTLYLFYDSKVAKVCQPVVEEVCRNIRRIQIPESKFEKLAEHEEINMGTTLFELYLVLKRFCVLGTALCPDTKLEINDYHIWFTPGVTHWLDIAIYKALTRIEKAIELDKLIPVDDTVKYSSSAVDTLAIFYQIKIFWQQLGWPDVEGAYMFVGKIVDDICRCCVFYADKMSQRMEEMTQIEDQQRFEVTSEWCLAINNIDYIRQSLSPFIKELGADEIIAKLSEFRSELEADRCAQTLRNVIENAIDTERNKILELIEVVAKKMSPAMRRFLTEGAEILHADSNSMDRLMMYMEESLKTLHMELNEVNFERILESIWTELSIILYDLVQSNLDKRRPPAFFSNLRDTLHLMVSSFKLQQSSERSCSDRDILENIERLLELHAYETADLIHQYYLERLADQEKMTDTPYGQLTVRCCFKDTVLQLEIMSARKLVPMDSNGNCDPFVKVHFMPADRFIGIASPKTSVQHKTLYPLYDEKFAIVLTQDQRNMSDALIVFSVKDKDLFGMSNQYIAECYLKFSAVESSNFEQVHLTLNRPVHKDTDCLRALEHRTGDKQAREFLKKLKQKSIS